MKISPISAAGTVVGSIETSAEAPKTTSQKMRALRMSTKSTPEVPPEVPAENLTTSDDNNNKTKEVAEDAQPLSPQFAALAKQRRALDVREKAIAEREKAAENQAPQGDVVTKAQLKSNPLGSLLDAGVTYDQLTEAVLANQNGLNPELQALKEEIKALKEGVDKTLSDRDASAEKAALAEMQREANSLSSQGDDFQLVRETKSVPQVMQLIERTYRESGEVLDVREALRLVEEELVKDGLRLANYPKIQTQLAPSPPVLQPQQRQMRTLTNRDTASVPLSRKARALAAFTGTLKK